MEQWRDFRQPATERAGFDSEATYTKPRQVPRERGLTWQRYHEEFEGQVPVLLEAAYAEMPCLKDGWVENEIMTPFRKDRVLFVAHSEKAEDRVMSTKLATFIKNVNKNSQAAWSYLHDEFFLKRHPHLMTACPALPPLLHGQDLFALMPRELAPQNATLLWGGRYSRSRLHVDSYNWTGTNVVLRGEKFFRLIPPGGHDRHLDVVMRTCGAALECVSYEGRVDLFERVPQGVPLWEAKLGPGDALVIPPGWWHQAVNLGNTLALASGLVTAKGGAWPAVAEVVKFHAQARPDWAWGKLPPAQEAELATEAVRHFRRFINALPDGAFRAAERWARTVRMPQEKEL